MCKWGQTSGDANANGDRPQAMQMQMGTDPESESRKYSIEFVAWKTEFLDKIKILYYFHNCNEYKNIYYVIDYSLLKTLFL